MQCIIMYQDYTFLRAVGLRSNHNPKLGTCHGQTIECDQELPQPQTTDQLRAPPGKNMTHACADPDIFTRGDPTLTKFFFQIMREGRSIYH